MRLGVLATHPIQYHAPLHRALARELDLTVYFAHRQTAEGQARAGFGVEFEWDVPLLDGYEHHFLENRASRADVSTFAGCDTPEIIDIIRRGQFDAFLVTGWYNKSFLQAIYACKRFGVPLMVRGDSQLATPRSLLKRIVKEGGYRLFLRVFDRCFYVGQRSKEYYEHYGVPAARQTFAPHFIDNRFFSEHARVINRDEARGELGVRSDEHVLLFVGKFIPEKSPADILHAASILEGRGKNIVCVFVGGGPLRADLEATAKELGIRTVFAGFKNQSELPTMYVAGDVLVLPSRSETWGLVVNEAFACGLPAVVSSSVGCAKDMIAEGETGATFTHGDVLHLADMLEQTLLLPRGRVKAALKSLVQRYSVETAASAILDEMRDLTVHATPRRYA